MSLILVDFSQCSCYSLAFSDPSLSLASFLVVDHHFLLCGVRLTVDKRDSHFSTCSLCLSRLSAPGSWESRFLTLLFFSPHPEAANLGLVSMVGLWDPVMSGFQPFLQRWLGYASIPPSQAVCLYLQSGWKGLLPSDWRLLLLMRGRTGVCVSLPVAGDHFLQVRATECDCPWSPPLPQYFLCLPSGGPWIRAWEWDRLLLYMELQVISKHCQSPQLTFRNMLKLYLLFPYPFLW